MRTGEISLSLRTWAERIRTRNRKQYELLCAAADRLDDLEERYAIMTEHEYVPLEREWPDPLFPPDDSELTDLTKEGDSN